MTNRTDQGTGKHGHKDSQEPWPHHGKEGSSGSERELGGGGRGGQNSGGREAQGGNENQGRSEAQRSGGESLKEREYRDSQGNVHHHTKTYEEQHGRK